jgi:hypothetical protein
MINYYYNLKSLFSDISLELLVLPSAQLHAISEIDASLTVSLPLHKLPNELYPALVAYCPQPFEISVLKRSVIALNF